ncbi:extensin family protein [Cereibacter sphaeroides]|uniref:extensin-like domain-containing protein n=1 Tax=Cereibacter sphaeroides TaxID=1063 RepID=UPI001F301287|nr:extensin family protein [Cereibacter sphaeroides]MCE6961375.1 extensin family protein [Cereibacter sphaeroides]MCE6973944.1 extensin family protein [Cereibacter sphaeroides]
MRAFGVAVLLTGLLAGTAVADAPSVSLRPSANPAMQRIAAATGSETTPEQVLRPRARPALKVASAPVATPAPAAAAQAPAMSFLAQPEPSRKRAGILGALFRPKARPKEEVTQAAAVRTRPGSAMVQGRRGSVCGDPTIRGEAIAPIAGRIRGCGIADPVKVTSIDGVQLSMSATMDCTTARALKSWINRGLRPNLASDVVRLEIAGAYTCRSRNNVRGAPVSEHGRGKAVDISGFTLANGKSVSVARDWRRDKPMRAAHRAACGIFGTTLGPGSDGYHEDHLHFDTVSRRSPYCR